MKTFNETVAEILKESEEEWGRNYQDIQGLVDILKQQLVDQLKDKLVAEGYTVYKTEKERDIFNSYYLIDLLSHDTLYRRGHYRIILDPTNSSFYDMRYMLYNEIKNSPEILAALNKHKMQQKYGKETGETLHDL